MKIGFANKYLLDNVTRQVGYVFAISSVILTFLDFSKKIKLFIFVGTLILSLFIYIANLIFANLMSFTTFKVGESEIRIQKGDIFSNEIFNNPDFIKVINANEYFDTIVNEEIISKRSVHGKFLLRSDVDVSKVDDAIKKDKRLNKRHKVGENLDREEGNQIKYELGSIFKYSDDVFLTALTHFDEYNKAYLSIQDFIRFLINFWDEIDELYAGRTVVITLFGSNLARLDNNTYSNTQILDTILWTFRLRRIKFKKPTKLIILLDRETNQKINYYKIKDRFYGLQE
ncbi:hypothetical protein LKI_09635 [Leuconostoc kimchii IMSNU 11154]|uniref:Thoeris protein ThsA Macro domain-containing protein n=1 Tax=Leuconostoc kimchii (strain IMSNU 11154 / KCTC 2386 / IH25) TaxID=762051 RepID=D5T4J5_LEUKI|nr:macro domain-containing protein [Leuconostoc kimchii]ADG41466.1 hypothetical protein LKI_09635 [Leuconostoc kimchii IMSNU 11154]